MRKILFLAASCLLMTSCVIDKRDLQTAEEKYTESFVEMFGHTDPEHTWMMVDNQTVEVDLDKPSRVKVYVKVDKDYKLAADYENVSGNRELHFDAPMGCEDVYVTVNGVPYHAPLFHQLRQDKALFQPVQMKMTIEFIHMVRLNFFKTIKKLCRNEKIIPKR